MLLFCTQVRYFLIFLKFLLLEINSQVQLISFLQYCLYLLFRVNYLFNKPYRIWKEIFAYMVQFSDFNYFSCLRNNVLTRLLDTSSGAYSFVYRNVLLVLWTSHMDIFFRNLDRKRHWICTFNKSYLYSHHRPNYSSYGYQTWRCKLLHLCCSYFYCIISL